MPASLSRGTERSTTCITCPTARKRALNTLNQPLRYKKIVITLLSLPSMLEAKVFLLSPAELGVVISLKHTKPPGTQGRKGPFQGQTPPFPRTPFGVRPEAVVFNDPPNLKAVACRFGALRAVPASHEQRYPPRLVRSCNSSAISMPHMLYAPCFSLCPNNPAAQPQPEKTVQISFFCDILLY